jgi:hypothetical protein
MTDEKTPKQTGDWAKKLMESYLKRAAEVHFKPYLQQISEGVQRAMKLIEAAGKTDKETSEEILRAVVVLNHAYLEDFLRSVALWLLPIAGEETLNRIPLVGATGRAEKFQLGKLAEHCGKKIDDVIRESVEAHLEHSNFNNVTEVMSFLDSINVTLPTPEEVQSSSDKVPRLSIDKNDFALLEAMMQRRHHIAHRGDKAKKGAGLQEITEAEVGVWLAATMKFTLSIATENFMQRHTHDDFVKATVEAITLATAKKKELKPAATGSPT